VNTTTKRRRGRPSIPKEVQRQRLMDAALRLLEKAHFEKTSVADIVREARMSSRSFYEQFKSKDDLVAEIVEEKARSFFERLQTALVEPSSEVERMARVMRAYLELFPRAAVDLERLGGEAGQRVRDVRRRYVQLGTDIELRWIEHLYEEGVIARIPPRATIEFLLTGIEGMSFRYYSEGRREELLALQPVLLGIFIRAMQPPRERGK
jgi:AcrR family transcriptional regulator